MRLDHLLSKEHSRARRPDRSGAGAEPGLWAHVPQQVLTGGTSITAPSRVPVSQYKLTAVLPSGGAAGGSGPQPASGEGP